MIILNLLPSPDKKRITKHYLILLIKDIILSLLLLSAVLGIIFLICHFMLIKNFIQISQSNLSVMQGEEIMTKEIRKINRDLKKIEEIQNQYTNWVEILINLNELVPDNEIQITNLGIDQPKNLITFQGKSLTREGFLTLKKNLEESEMFGEIKSPLSNLLFVKNFNFKLEANLKTD